jgi:hypothetical protein
MIGSTFPKKFGCSDRKWVENYFGIISFSISQKNKDWECGLQKLPEMLFIFFPLPFHL